MVPRHLGGRRYQGAERAYRHTAPISSIVGLHEGLRRVLTEGLDARWARHAEVRPLFQKHIQDPRCDPAGPGEASPAATRLVRPHAIDELLEV